jgi:signal transduction histidine kinase
MIGKEAFRSLLSQPIYGAGALLVVVIATGIAVLESGVLLAALVFFSIVAVVLFVHLAAEPMAAAAPDSAAVAQELKKVRSMMEMQEKSAKLLIRRDLELTRANERLHDLDLMKSNFVTVVTHQLRTPLSGIRWTLGMFLRGDLGALTNEQKTFLMKAYESNNRMVLLLRDMLLTDKIESGKLKSGESVSLLPDLPENLIVELMPLALKKNVALNFTHPENSYPPVRIDPEQLRAVLQNLIENAIKYTNPQGKVDLNIQKADKYIRFTVADNGIGIPEKNRKEIFSRFFRAPNAVKVETDGSGLGLFIAKSIVEKNEGTIEFTSEENVGTTFVVQLPARRDATV